MDPDKLEELLEIQLDLLAIRHAHGDLLPLTQEQLELVLQAERKIHWAYHESIFNLLEQKDEDAIPDFLQFKRMHNAFMTLPERTFASDKDQIDYLLVLARLIINKKNYIRPVYLKNYKRDENPEN